MADICMSSGEYALAPFPRALWLLMYDDVWSIPDRLDGTGTLLSELALEINYK